MSHEVISDVLRFVVSLLIVMLVVQVYLAKRRVMEAFTRVENLHEELAQLRREKQMYRDELAGARTDVQLIRSEVADLRRAVLSGVRDSE